LRADPARSDQDLPHDTDSRPSIVCPPAPTGDRAGRGGYSSTTSSTGGSHSADLADQREHLEFFTPSSAHALRYEPNPMDSYRAVGCLLCAAGPRGAQAADPRVPEDSRRIAAKQGHRPVGGVARGVLVPPGLRTRDRTLERKVTRAEAVASEEEQQGDRTRAGHASSKEAAVRTTSHDPPHFASSTSCPRSSIEHAVATGSRLDRRADG